MQQGGELMLPEGSAVPDGQLAVQSDGASFRQLARASDLAAVQLNDDLRECPALSAVRRWPPPVLVACVLLV
jgi:hypothetical protein